MKIQNWLFGVFFVINSFSIFSWASKGNSCDDLFTFYARTTTIEATQHYKGLVQNYTSDATGPMPKSLKLGTYNVLDLIEHPVKSALSHTISKNPVQLIGNARVIKDINPDLQILVEVQSLNALSRFNELYLDGIYEPFLIEGNDIRGIHIGVLVKRTLPIQFQWRSYKDFAKVDGNPVFVRDLPVGLVTPKGSHKPILAVIGAHFKSRRVAEGQADNTALIREREAEGAAEIVKILQKEFGQELTIVIGGDFNTPLHSSPELAALFSAGLKDTLDFTEKTFGHLSRATHFYFPESGAPVAAQLDGLLIKSQSAIIKDAKVYADRNRNGDLLPPPVDYHDRQSRPSDHRAIGIEIQLP